MTLPNQLTTLRIVLTPVFLFLFISDDPTLKQLALVVFFVAAITDWYDGWLARKFNYITEWGKFLDPLADKILVSTAFFAFAFTNVLELWMVVVIVVRDFLITGLRFYAQYLGSSMRTSRLAKWKTFLQMFFIYYLLLVFTLKTVDWINAKYINIIEALTRPDFIYLMMLSVTLITIISGVQYLLNNRKLLKKIFA